MYEIAFDTRRTKELEQDNHQLISRTPSPPWYEQQQKTSRSMRSERVKLRCNSVSSEKYMGNILGLNGSKRNGQAKL